MHPGIWGPTFWRVIHVIAHIYPINPSANHIENTTQLITLLVKHLPCPACAMHGIEYLRKHPIDATSRVAFRIWVNDFHNDVNTRRGKAVLTIRESELNTTSWIKGRVEQISHENTIHTTGVLDELPVWVQPSLICVLLVAVIILSVALHMRSTHHGPAEPIRPLIR